MNLYELTGAYRDLDNKISMSENPAEELDAMQEMADIADAIDVKCENIAMMWRNHEADAKAFKAEEDHWKAKRVAAENRVKWLKAYVHDQLTQLGVTKAGGKMGVRIQKNGQAALVFIEGTEVPSEYMVTPPPEPDTALIREELANGVKLPFAELVTGTHPRVY